MSNISPTRGLIYAPYVPNLDRKVPFGLATLDDLIEVCRFIEGLGVSHKAADIDSMIKNYTGFSVFTEQEMVRDLIYQIKKWEFKLRDYHFEKCGVSPADKDWPSLKKAISEATVAYRSEYETYLAMLKLNNIDFEYFKFNLKY